MTILDDIAAYKRDEVAAAKVHVSDKENDARVGSAEPKWEEISPYVDQALIELPEPTRTLLVRHFLQGTPQATLAAEMNTSAATISRTIQVPPKSRAAAFPAARASRIPPRFRLAATDSQKIHFQPTPPLHRLLPVAQGPSPAVPESQVQLEK